MGTRERPRHTQTSDPPRERDTPPTGDVAMTRFSRALGSSRYIVLLAVVAVLLVAITLFLLGMIQAVMGVWHAIRALWDGQMNTTDLTVEFLEIVTTMLKAVVFYIIGVGLYGLFIAPLNLTVSLGVETLNDLESEVVSVVIVILGVTFLEHFIRWEQPVETLQFGAGMALAVGVLVLFQYYNHQVKEAQYARPDNDQAQAQHDLFDADEVEQKIRPDTAEANDQANV